MIINIQSSMAVTLGSEEVYFTGVEVELVVSVNFSKSTILGGTSFFPHNFNLIWDLCIHWIQLLKIHKLKINNFKFQFGESE